MKKLRPPVRKAGIWLDQENAYVVQMTDGEEPVVKRIKSGVESRIRIKGEGRVSARFGHTFIDDQEKNTTRATSLGYTSILFTDAKSLAETLRTM